MKKYFILLDLAIVLLLCSCESAESKKTVKQIEAQLNNLSEEEISLTDKNRTRQGGPYGEISVILPDEWEYELCPVDSEDLLSGIYGIHLFPKGTSDGYIELAYYDSFGVCGTGLDKTTIFLAGNDANLGIYDNHEYWDFIAFHGTYEGIVAQTYSVENWWADYSDDVLNILNTLEFDTNTKEGAAYIPHNDSDVEKIGLHFSVKDISAAGATMVFNQYDAEAPKGELEFGQLFSIEVQNGDAWTYVPTIIDSFGVEDIAYIIPKDGTRTYQLDWEWLYGTLAPGNYRLSTAVNDFVSAENYDSYTVYAYFILN